MEKIPKTPPTTPPISPNVTKSSLDTQGKVTLIPSQKVRVLPWIILGLVVSFILVGFGSLLWKWLPLSRQPDLIVSAPLDHLPSTAPIPTPTGETTTLVPPEISFEEKPYQNELAKFEINIPLGWKIDDTGKSKAIVVIIDPKVTIASDSALLTMVSVSTGTTNDILENEVKKIRDGFLATYDSYTIKDDKQMLLGGKIYHLLGGNYLAKGTIMKNRTLININNHRAYAISATAPESVWVEKERLINATIFSFKPI